MKPSKIVLSLSQQKKASQDWVSGISPLQLRSCTAVERGSRVFWNKTVWPQLNSVCHKFGPFPHYYQQSYYNPSVYRTFSLYSSEYFLTSSTKKTKKKKQKACIISCAVHCQYSLSSGRLNLIQIIVELV